MSPILACVVCARPFDSLLTSGLHAGVAVMAVVADVVIGPLVRGPLAIVRQDAAFAREADAGARPEVAP